MIDILLESRLKPHLTFDAVVSKTPEWWARHYQIDRVVTDLSQLFKGVSDNEFLPCDGITAQCYTFSRSTAYCVTRIDFCPSSYFNVATFSLRSILSLVNTLSIKESSSVPS